LAASHPAADSLTREKAIVDLESIKDRVSPAEFERLTNDGQSLTLNDVRQMHPGDKAD
jgi:hypothetical protein